MSIAMILAANIVLQGGLGGGASTTRDEGAGAIVKAAAILSARVARDDKFWSIGLRGLLIPGGGDYASGNVQDPHNGGLNAWGLFADLGAHTPGPLRLELRGGVGFGELGMVNCDCTENQPYTGSVAPAFIGSLSVSGAISPEVRLGLEFGAMLFTGIGHQAGTPGNGAVSSAEHPAASDLSHATLHLLAFVSWDFHHL
jgi:hypothetical protein